MFDETNLKIETLAFSGVLKLTQEVFSDERGEIWSLYTKSLHKYLSELGLEFQHVKFNTNKRGVIRGIHYDNSSTKLITCVAGSVTQFVVDVDPASKTYKQYEKFDLKAGDGVSILLPPGYGNAFVVNESQTTYCYMLSYPGKYVDADAQRTIQINDPAYNIDWGIDEPIVSSRDKKSIKQ